MDSGEGGVNVRLEVSRPIRPYHLPNHLEVTVARSLDDLLQMAAIRAVVYMGEQACPYSEEFDGNDFNGATHLIARLNGQPVGVMRIRWFADFVKFERFAILPGKRGGEIARALFDASYDLSARKG